MPAQAHIADHKRPRLQRARGEAADVGIGVGRRSGRRLAQRTTRLTLRIELKGNLAAMLAAAQKTKRPPETGDLFEQVALVAGARNRRYLELWNGAA